MFTSDVSLPRGLEREIVRHRDREYTLRGSESRTLATVGAFRVYYRYLARTIVGSKYLCVVVKVAPEDAFLITAYLTDKVKKGRVLWPSAV